MGSGRRARRPACTTIAIDLPGHGFSADLERYDHAEVADRIHALVARLADAPPLVVGHSLGAAIATVYAGRHPVRGVVNVDQPLRVAGLVAVVQANAEALRSDGFYGFMDDLKGLFELGLLPEDARRLVARCWHPRPPSVLGYWDALLQRPAEDVDAGLESALRAVRAPYLAVHGTEPEPGYAAWLSACAPDAELVVFPGTGHFPHLARPAEFARLLVARAGACDPL